METKKDTWHIIGRGFAGWHAQGINCSSTGGDIGGYTYWTGAKCAGYAAEAVDGCLVYDAAHLEKDSACAEAFIKHVISGPMVNPGIAEDTGATSLSYVTVETFERMLRALPGNVRIGRIRNGAVIWENETI